MKDCVSLDTAKKLKEAGWPQEPVGAFYYAVGKASKHVNLRTEMYAEREEPYFDFYDAPTIGELLEALEERGVALIGRKKTDGLWYASSAQKPSGSAEHANPADALALLWMALKEKGLV